MVSLRQHRPFKADLERLRKIVSLCRSFPPAWLKPGAQAVVNPSLEVMQTNWAGLGLCLEDNDTEPTVGEETVLVWKHPHSGTVHCRTAEAGDLLALKIVHDEVQPIQAAGEGGVSLGAIEAVLSQAAENGLILQPVSRLQRDDSFLSRFTLEKKEFLTTDIFTLQWHITQACDLNCRHCYDRSVRTMMPYERATMVLDDFYAFCKANKVRGQVTFTGGNPLLYPRFGELYQEAADRGFLLAILGNPTNEHNIEELKTIQHPEFYQVSLEGLEQHNDEIRGRGHFRRVMEFLEILKKQSVFSMVMLTLTRDNLNDVLPLAEQLREKVNIFVFNRLTLFGEGAALQSVGVEEFNNFLQQYEQAARHNPIMALKDNLFNRRRSVEGLPVFGGCAGFGCGAVFNFVSLLPDGEVHACRKFPSLIGNVFEQPLLDIYSSPPAEKYRRGSEACSGCSIRAVCGGCPAVVAGHGRDPFVDRDPYCQGCLDEDSGQGEG